MNKPAFGTPEQRGNVTIYPAAPVEKLRIARGEGKTKVAAYVRVSTDSTQQEGSLVLQREYFENLIKNNPEYEFVEIYADEGISATSVEKRKGFLKMMEDCKTGKIDLILTKSISRFARNLGDLLHYVNMLNSLSPPVEIYFEADKLSTFGASGEILMMVLGLCAQEESRLKSEAVTWAVDNLYAQGKFYVPQIYGFTKEKGRDKPLIINEEEAKIVRLCYAMTIAGYSFSQIAETLNSFGIKSRLGNSNWTAGSVKGLLSNEKYIGDLRARKTVTPNYKTHKAKKNEGEKPQYYVMEHHEPIVPQLAYEVALKIMKNRNGNVDGIPCLKAVPEGILWQAGKIFVSNAVFRLIGKPAGILLRWNATKRTLIIEPTDINDPDGFPVIGRMYAKCGSLFIGSVTLIYEIWEVVEWDKMLRYRIVAKYNEKSNVAIFEMKDAIASEIPKNKYGRRPKKLNLKSSSNE